MPLSSAGHVHRTAVRRPSTDRWSAVVTSTRLRRATATDAEFLYSMASDASVMLWVGDGKPWTRTYFDRRFARALATTDIGTPDLPMWSIGVDEDVVPVGLLSLIRRSDHVEVGYWVHPDHWGNGYAGSMLSQAREIVGDLALVATVARGNAASRRVLEKAGFTVVHDGDPLT
ncbi:GNAT family N-acetyltransferase [Rhodococcus fascians]|nr:GNAT family N-acetyltransferase [Rhodococcus fascians]MBY3998069.1 GNAT family N-acetyltransferase [Rhodococcus fascians]MBY4004257.1 GNAT family N-acetyltransferase [Rhodococcus fascians]MBY4008881.1 GNAT family N-acetyltransferase [Rhodococcus fascians]MBY4019464.1 GNAT family N-acetyltransferase [Rhodococcus fascians]